MDPGPIKEFYFSRSSMSGRKMDKMKIHFIYHILNCVLVCLLFFCSSPESNLINSRRVNLKVILSQQF